MTWCPLKFWICDIVIEVLPVLTEMLQPRATETIPQKQEGNLNESQKTKKKKTLGCLLLMPLSVWDLMSVQRQPMLSELKKEKKRKL